MVDDNGTPQSEVEGFDPNVDRYPDIAAVVEAVLDDPEFPEGDVERIEITALANGEATWRVWPARAEQPVGGVYLTE